MILSEYQAKREDLEKKLQEISDREVQHKMELSVKYQASCKRIASQMGQLKHARAELNKQYQNDKTFFHRKYRDEKREVIERIHALRMEYLTVNGLEDKRPGASAREGGVEHGG